MKRRDWGPLLELGDGRKRPPLPKASAKRIPLGVLLDQAERDERQGRLPFAGVSVAVGSVDVVSPTSDPPDGSGGETGTGAPPRVLPATKARGGGSVICPMFSRGAGESGSGGLRKRKNPIAN